jgi:hypothetical protein
MLQFGPVFLGIPVLYHVSAPPASPKYWINISTVAEKPTALQAGTEKVGGNIRILGQIRALYSQSNFRGKYQHFGLLFF